MNIGWVAAILVSFALIHPNTGNRNHSALGPSWQFALNNPDLRQGVFSGTPQTNRSCGIARWDQTHVLIYFMGAIKHLVARSSATSYAGGWSFTVLIVDTNSGAVEHSVELPADSSQSELAVVTGGIVVSDRNHLVFYSRTFTRIDPSFAYTPLDAPLLQGTLGDPEYLYATDSLKYLVFVDNAGPRSHFFLFDGQTFKLLRDWILSGVDVECLKVEAGKIIYGRLIFGDHETNTFWWTTINTDGDSPQVLSTTSDDLVCRFPIPAHPDTFLNICGSIRIVKGKISTTIYERHKNEIVEDRVRISPDGRFAAILRYGYKYGGVLDLNEHWIQPGLLIVDLSAPVHVQEIPLNPIPRSQLAFNFANNSTLIVLDDGRVSAYQALRFQ